MNFSLHNFNVNYLVSAHHRFSFKNKQNFSVIVDCVIEKILFSLWCTSLIIRIPIGTRRASYKRNFTERFVLPPVESGWLLENSVFHF